MGADSWVTTFRRAVTTTAGQGYYVKDSRGIRLIWQVEGYPAEGVNLGLAWAEASMPQALRLIEETTCIHRDRKPIHLRDALREAAGMEQRPQLSWADAVDRFLALLEDSTSAKTLKAYRATFAVMLDTLGRRNAPTTALQLLEAVVKAKRATWLPGSRSRSIALQQICRFLRFRVQADRLSEVWLPPQDLTLLLGGRTNDPKAPKPRSLKVSPLEDGEIVALVEALSRTEAGRRWATAIKMIATWGLRPTEIQHLELVHDSTGRPVWICNYQKRAGSTGRTKPRRLRALPPAGTNWGEELTALKVAGALELPSLNDKGGVAAALGQYLKRQRVWQSMALLYAERGQNIGTYAFRHSWTQRCDEAGLTPSQRAAAGGHDARTLLQHYSQAGDAAIDAAFEQARERLH